MLDYLRASAMLAARTSGIALGVILFFCLGAARVFAGEAKRQAHMKQPSHMRKIASVDLAEAGCVMNISITAVAR